MNSVLRRTIIGLRIHGYVKDARVLQSKIFCPSVIQVHDNSLLWNEIPNIKPVKNVKGIKYPERRRLMILDRQPIIPTHSRPQKSQKRLIDMRGPEEIHNSLVHRQYGIRALGGGRLHWGHLELIRNGINRKMDESCMFAEWRIESPWKPVTKKGLGQRMGGGKGAIDHYVTPIRAGRIIVEVGGDCDYQEVFPFLRIIAEKLPFKAEVVNDEILQAEKREKQWEEDNNLNPFTFEYCVKNNMLGCRSWASPYDYLWHGKHR